MMQYILKSL